jgi:hypothetical protein
MDIGVLPEFRNPTQWAIPIEQVYWEGIEKAVRAERLGFDHFWTSEHHFAVDSWSPSLLTILAAAARTERIRLAMPIALAPASFASWPTSEPTGPLAAATTTVSPGFGLPIDRRPE